MATKNTVNKEAFVTIRLPRDRGNKEDAKFVSINDRNWLIKRAIDVKVPACVAEVLRDEEDMTYKADEFNMKKESAD